MINYIYLPWKIFSSVKRVNLALDTYRGGEKWEEPLNILQHKEWKNCQAAGKISWAEWGFAMSHPTSVSWLPLTLSSQEARTKAGRGSGPEMGINLGAWKKVKQNEVHWVLPDRKEKEIKPECASLFHVDWSCVLSLPVNFWKWWSTEVKGTGFGAGLEQLRTAVLRDIVKRGSL